MSDGGATPRDGLERLVGGELLGRIRAAEDALVFVLDGARTFRYFDDGLAAVYDGHAPLALGTAFRAELLMPSSRVSRSVAAAQDGHAPDPFLVFARHSDDASLVWHLELLPLASSEPSLEHGVVGVLWRAGERPLTTTLDPLLHTAAFSERLERERLETTQAVAVTMRHEINNALTSLIGNAELILRRDDDLDPQTAARVREIAHQGRRIQTVLDRLEQLTEIRTTTYYGGVQMIELGEDEENRRRNGGERSTVNGER